MAVLEGDAGWDLGCDAAPQIAVLQRGMEMEMRGCVKLYPEPALGISVWGRGGELLPLGGV